MSTFGLSRRGLVKALLVIFVITIAHVLFVQLPERRRLERSRLYDVSPRIDLENLPDSRPEQDADDTADAGEGYEMEPEMRKPR